MTRIRPGGPFTTHAEGELVNEPSEQTIRKWINQAERDEGIRSDGLTSTECEELRRLRLGPIEAALLSTARHGCAPPSIVPPA